MKLISVAINNFKSIKEIELKISDNLYCLIGRNESGKSNILQAIALLEETYKPSNPDQESKLNRILKSATISGRFEIIESEKKDIARLLRLLRPVNTSAFQVSAQVLEIYNFENIKAIRVEVRKSLAGSNSYFIELKNGTSIGLADLSDKTKAAQLLTGIQKLMPSISYYANEEFLIKPVSPDELLKNPSDPSLMSFKKLLL